MFSGIFLLSVIALFVLGMVVGSFLNVVIYRTVIGESWVTGRSKCEDCERPIFWFDNIPILSYLLLRGKCRHCHKPIAISHPVIEFLTGSLFVWWYVGGAFFFRLTQQPFHYIQPLFWLIVGMLLVVIFFADLRYSIIPDEAVIVLGALTFFYRLALMLLGIMQPIDFWLALVAAAGCSGFFFSLWYFTKGKGMGLGDVKLAIPFALLLGWPNVIVGIFLSFVSGSVVSVILMAAGKKTLKHTIPFGPFMVFGLIFTLLFGSRVVTWYLSLL